MKGLLIKDLLNLKKQSKLILALSVFYIAISVATSEAGTLIGMIMIMCTMMSFSSMSYDELSNWDKYALSMPIDRKTIVISKYILAVVLGIIGALIVVVFGFISSIIAKNIVIYDVLMVLYVTSMIALIMVSVCFPLMFKFGPEGGRMYLIVTCFVPGIAIAILMKMGIPMPSEAFLETLMWIAPIIVIAIVAISIMLSIKIYNKKEF